MLYFDITDFSERIDVNQTSASNECDSSIANEVISIISYFLKRNPAA